MTDIAKFLSEDFIVVPMLSDNAGDAIKELLRPLEERGIIDSSDSCGESILKRERRMSTGVGKGIALPHGVSDGIDHLAVVMGLSRDGIEFRSVDSMLCHIFVLMISPRDEPDKHLKVLSRFTKALHAGALRSSIMEAKNPEQVMQILNDQIVSDEDEDL